MTRRLTAYVLIASGCLDGEPLDPEPTNELATPLLGESCSPAACTLSQCGVVADGCRSEMWCGDCGAVASTTMVSQRELSRVFEAPLGIGSFTIATSGLSVGTDPVIHILNSSGSEIAFDDNSGGGTNAALSVTLVTSGRLIVRAKSEAARGTGTITINGSTQSIAIGGTFQTMSGLRSGEAIETVKLFGSRTDQHVIYRLAADGLHLASRAAANGTSGAAILAPPTLATATFVFGTLGATTQPARVLRNDAAVLFFHDSDGDGLGDELEAALGTCSSASALATGPDGQQFDCTTAVDPRDTDGDGLSDAIEVRGVRGVTVHQPLPLWGSDPRHKDMFAEFDVAQTSAGIPAKLTPTEARRFSDYYGDRTRALTPLAAAYHAASLNNPDRKPGIRTHLDTGVVPATPSDARLYGDWGGASIVPPTAGGTPPEPNAAMAANLGGSRLGVFRYAFQYVGGGGQNSTSVGGLGFGSYAWSSGNEIDTFTHESAHAHGLAHSGPAKPNGGVDPNCKASYFSIVNYAFQGAGYGFSDGLGFAGINNVRATEWQSIPHELQSTLAGLRDNFGYKVDVAAGHVDWNRDGVFAPSGTTVRAYTNFQPGNACEFTRYNPNYLPSTMNTRVSPALARFDGAAYLFTGGSSTLRFVTAPTPFACAVTSADPCVSWSAPQTVALDATRGVDATLVSNGVSGSLLVVTVGGDGRLWYVQRFVSALGVAVWSTPALVPGADVATGEPSLVTLADGSGLLMYRRPTGELVEAQFAASLKGLGGWTRIGVARATNGAALVQAPQAAPGMVQAQFAGTTSTTYGLFAEGPDAVLALWQYLPATRQWQRSPIPFDDSTVWWRSVSGRPSGAWVPSSDNAQGGRLYLITSSRDGYESDPQRIGTGRGIIMRMSYADPITGQLRIGAVSPYNSWWDYTFGVDAMYDPSTGDNLRVAWSISPTTSPAQDSVVKFDPKADGLIDFTQTNYNDWPYVGFALCQSLVNPLGTGGNVIRCGDRPPVTN